MQDKELRLLMTQNRLTVNDFDPEKQRYVEKSKAQKAAGARLFRPGLIAALCLRSSFGLLLGCTAVASVLHSLVHPNQLRQKDVSHFFSNGLLRA